jgi:hypothetical protein
MWYRHRQVVTTTSTNRRRLLFVSLFQLHYDSKHSWQYVHFAQPYQASIDILAEASSLFLLFTRYTAVAENL